MAVNVLVTGGAGFIGSALVERLLAEGHEVEVVDDLSTGSLHNLAPARAEGSGRLRINQADVLDDGFADLVARRSPEVVFHLATATAKVGRSPVAQAGHDLAGLLTVLEAAARAGVRKVVWCASARAQHDLVRGVADRAVVEYLQAYRARDGLASTTVVAPTVYGPRQTTRTESCVVAVLVARVLAGDRCVLHGGGAQGRDLLYVDDAVDALVRAMDAGDGEVVEIGWGKQVSVAELHHLVVEACAAEQAAVVEGDRRRGDPDTVDVDPSSARDALGWEPWTPLRDGLAAVVAAVRADEPPDAPDH